MSRTFVFRPAVDGQVFNITVIRDEPTAVTVSDGNPKLQLGISTSRGGRPIVQIPSRDGQFRLTPAVLSILLEGKVYHHNIWDFADAAAARRIATGTFTQAESIRTDNIPHPAVTLPDGTLRVFVTAAEMAGLGPKDPGVEYVVEETAPVLRDPDLILSGVPVSQGTVGKSYDFTPTVTGGRAPYGFAISAGRLPAGVTLNALTGQISGVPTTAQSLTGIVLQVADSQVPASTASLAAFNLAIAAALAAPVSTALPAISGTATVGGVLTSTTGAWTGNPAPSFTRQWKRDGAAIGGATGTIYTTVGADSGKTISVTVTATNSQNSASVTSAGLAVTVAATAPAKVATPTATGTGSSRVISWTTPADGGAAITDYVIRLDGATVNDGVGTGTNQTLTGLADGTHSVTVAAVNGVGTGTSSDTLTITIASAPPPTPSSSPTPTVTPTSSGFAAQG